MAPHPRLALTSCSRRPRVREDLADLSLSRSHGLFGLADGLVGHAFIFQGLIVDQRAHRLLDLPFDIRVAPVPTTRLQVTS